MTALAENPRAEVIVVSGLPRSGTSLMMRMLARAGIPLLCDDVREADEDNPNGYYEYDPVKRLARDDTWLPRARGKAVKVVSPLLQSLPLSERYAVIFMRRTLDEVLRSQEQMMVRRGEQDDVPRKVLLETYAQHLAQTKLWLRRAGHLRAHEVDYNALVRGETDKLQAVAKFLARPLDCTQMAAEIKQELYRQRANDRHVC